MTFANLYFIAALVFPVSVVAWALSRQIKFWESLAVTGISLSVALIVHMIASQAQGGNDIQLLHGRVKTAEFIPRWEEYYEEAIYRTEWYTETVQDSDGKGSHTEMRSREVFDHWEPETRWHDSEWYENDTFGTCSITESRYRSILSEFGKQDSHRELRSTGEHASRQISGDPNVYNAANINDARYPVHVTSNYTNRIILNPSLFNFIEPPGFKSPAEFPMPSDRFDCQISLGRPGWDNRQLERVVSVLGPERKVNLMCVGMDGSVDDSVNLEAHWKGGKRNDLVICFGGPKEHPTWVRCFGWSESLLVFRNLESMLLREGFTNESLAKTEAEIRAGYKIKDWHTFDYLPLRISNWWAVLLIGMIAFAVGCWWIFFDIQFADARSRSKCIPLDFITDWVSAQLEKRKWLK